MSRSIKSWYLKSLKAHPKTQFIHIKIVAISQHLTFTFLRLTFHWLTKLFNIKCHLTLISVQMKCGLLVLCMYVWIFFYNIDRPKHCLVSGFSLGLNNIHIMYVCSLSGWMDDDWHVCMYGASVSIRARFMVIVWYIRNVYRHFEHTFIYMSETFAMRIRKKNI